MLHSSSRSCAGNRRASPLPFVGFAAVCICAAPAVAQSLELPPLQVTVSADDETYYSEISGTGFAFVKCTTEPSAAGAWYRGVAGATILDEGYFEQALGLEGMRPALVQLGTIANNFPPVLTPPWGNLYTGTPWNIHAHPTSVHSALSVMLEQGGQPSYNAVVGNAVPLLYASPQIEDSYHLAPYSLHGWLRDSDTHAFNLDSVRQPAVWANVDPEWEGSQDEFFGSPEYALICKYPVQLSITLVGARGPWVVPGPSIVAPCPVLDDYPYMPPKLTRSGPALITYSGTNSTYVAFTPPAAGFTPIFSVPPGGTVHIPASGYAPGMQVAVFSMSASPSQRFDLNPAWCGYGKIALTMPGTAAAGIFEVRYCRYQEPGPSGPIWGPWRLIPVGQRAHLLVTS